LALAIVLLCNQGCVVSTPTVSPAVQPSEAHKAVEQWWPQNEVAYIAGDGAALKSLYAGAGLDAAQGEMTAEDLKAARPKYPRPYRSSTVYVPAKGASSQWFLAIVAYAPIDQDGRAYSWTTNAPGLLFAKNDGSWKVAGSNMQAPIPHPLFASKEITFAAALPDERYIMAKSEVPAAYVNYLNALSAGKTGEVPFATGLSSFAPQFSRLSWPPNVPTRFAFTIDNPSLATYSFSESDKAGSEVLVFVVRRSVTVSATPGCVPRRQGDFWSDVVPVGNYKSVILTSVAIVAASVPLSDGNSSQGRKVIDISASSRDISATVTKC
jgi:hypothetical protein